ncbi:MAG: RNA-processing protein [Methanomicrobiales archaeon]|jgi:nucleolar protein 56|nr:RNA-processing protein [Methanomicrobiales archaeon]
MRRYWFSSHGGSGDRAALGDPDEIAGRLEQPTRDREEVLPVNWQDAQAVGVARDRREYLVLLREVALHLVRRRLASALGGGEAVLLQMVRLLDGVDFAIALLADRALEWHRVVDPSFSRKFQRAPALKALLGIGEDGMGDLGGVIAMVTGLSDLRSDIKARVTRKAEEIMPNCSSLIGGLLAAKLAVEAGGLTSLASLPASTVQVLGAKTALFSHLTAGTPPPKHGVLYQHPMVRRAGRGVRGRVARVLAAKIAIAARIDHYRGELSDTFLEGAREAIRQAGMGQ